jgi:hypothetical protein
MTNKKTKSQKKSLPEEGNDCAESPSPEAVERPTKSIVELAQKKLENGTAKERKALEVAKTCNTSSNSAGESPAVPIARFRHVVIPHLGMGNHPGDAWCKRPGRPRHLEVQWSSGGCNLRA